MPTKNDIKDYVRGVIQKHDTRLATPTNAGLMSTADKIKLDNIQFDFESGTLRLFTSKGILTFTATGRDST